MREAHDKAHFSYFFFQGMPARADGLRSVRGVSCLFCSYRCTGPSLPSLKAPMPAVECIAVYLYYIFSIIYEIVTQLVDNKLTAAHALRKPARVALRSW